MSVAFTKKDSAETASETLLPDRPISPHPNLVTEAGVKALEFQLDQAREAYQTAQMIEDVNERRRQAASRVRDMRYFAARIRTAQVIADPVSADTVAFGRAISRFGSNIELLRGNLNCLLLGLGCDNTWPSELSSNREQLPPGLSGSKTIRQII
jgi:hypothetical protein